MDRYHHLEADLEADYSSDDDQFPPVNPLPPRPPPLSKDATTRAGGGGGRGDGGGGGRYWGQSGGVKGPPPSVVPKRPLPPEAAAAATARYNGGFEMEEDFDQASSGYTSDAQLRRQTQSPHSHPSRQHDDKTFDHGQQKNRNFDQAFSPDFERQRNRKTNPKGEQQSVDELDEGFGSITKGQVHDRRRRTGLVSALPPDYESATNTKTAVRPAVAPRRDKAPPKPSPHDPLFQASRSGAEVDDDDDDDDEDDGDVYSPAEDDSKATYYKHEDLANLEFLDDEIVLEELKRRFDEQQPYTYVGDSLVALNPCRPLDIYHQEFHDKYQQLHVRAKAPAHIFWIAAQVYGNLVNTLSSQCVVVGGDSGAGKTESTKYILQHLVRTCTGSGAQAQGSGHQEPLSATLVEKLEKANPLLELFGNAATVLNENSSRFGKLVELEYDEHGVLNTARLECFILEKFRVTSRNPRERNFHVFYAIFAGLSDPALADLGLDLQAEAYRILKPWDSTESVFRTQEELQSHATRWSQLQSMLQDVGFKEEETSSLLKALAAILLISNVDFEHSDPDLDDTLVLDSTGSVCLASAADVLGLDSLEEFQDCLLEVSVDIKGERMTRQKTLRQARDGRDALARELYSVLFYGVIDKINHSLRHGSTQSSSHRNPCIRLLDISGFENVSERNGFEQFIINSTNEKLHQFFLQHTFTKELHEYELEGLPRLDIAFTDNDHIVQLIFAKPEGLIPLLEDEIATNGNDRGWLDKCRARSQPSTHFSAKALDDFRLTHYAGQVDYTAEGFVMRNSDTLPHNLRQVVQRSENTFIQDYFVLGSEAAAALHRNGRASMRKSASIARRRGIPTSLAGKEGGAGQRTGKLTGRFTDQYLKSLAGMMNKLHTATPVFVRCIKPNLELESGQWDKAVVMDQLKSSGLLDVTRIRKEGYPLRIKFNHFVKRYKDILDHVDVSSLKREDQLRKTCDVILSSAGVTEHRMGHSKVFLKMDHRDQLEQTLDRKIKAREAAARREEEERERATGEQARELQAARDGAARKEDDMSSTYTDPFSATANSSESGFALGHYHSSEKGLTKGEDILINIPEKDIPSEMEESEETEEAKLKKKKEKKKKEGLGNQPAFNIFRLTERDFENSTEFEMKMRRFVRLVLYILLQMLILSGGVVSRMALVWLGSGQLRNEATSDINEIVAGHDVNVNEFRTGLAPTRLLICHFVPLFIAWISSFFKVLFGRKDWPTVRAIVLVTIQDCLSVFGRSVFLFKVLPNTDSLTAVVMGTAVCQIPAILKMTSLLLVGNASLAEEFSSRRWSRLRHYGYVLLVFIAMLVQLGVVPMLHLGNDVISAMSGPAETALKLPPLWVLIVATLCSSIGWWPNFAYGCHTVGCCKKGLKQSQQKGPQKPKEGSWSFSAALSQWRIEMTRVRQTSFVYTGPVQMILLVALYFAFNDPGIDCFQQIQVLFSSLGASFTDSTVLTSHFNVYSLVYMQMVGTLVSPYLAAVACRLYMQRAAFAFPIVLVAPACLALTLACTPSDLVTWYDIRNHCVTADVTRPAVLFLLVVGVATWLSTVIINTHIWFPEVERTAKMEKLFAFPHRDPIFLDMGLQCSRRQDKQENAERKRRHKKTDGKTKPEVERPTVYICATMWHEIRLEMLSLLKSLFRVDFDVYTRRKAMSQFDLLEEHSDLYDPEFHLIFDDAFETDSKTKQRVINSWVRQFIEVMPEAMGSVAKRNIDLNPPTKIPTPYGGRMEWFLPGGTRMYVHLKDKNLIRHRKRWSQILYLYYLLGFRLMGDYKTVDDALKSGSHARKRRHRVRKNTSLLNNMSASKVREADNIFLMTLDGDVDFRPEAVRLLLDRMKKNKNVAAVCGRIHPIGDGPMVWYQQFEYAVGHWLQKAAEHVFGCVLCCPGCFSLLRGSPLMDDSVMRMYTTEPTEMKKPGEPTEAIHFIQYGQGEDCCLCTLLLRQGWKIEYCAGLGRSALMDDNVMRMYTTEPTEAIHFIQYEQGEDRWLCTLLLQQGWKIEYCAGADALTFAPETFHDFYIQRRRWSPSTMANIIDLIGSWRITVKMNDNISVLFMLYQFVLMASSILAPGVVVYMIAGSYNSVLSLGLWESYFISVVPVFLYVLLCLRAKTDTQINIAATLSSVYAIVRLLVTINVAAILSSVYAIVMLLVTVGTVINVATSDVLAPDVLFIICVAVVFVLAGIIHPNELFCLFHGVLYYITVPSTFVFLTVFFVCNMHVVTWGTREGPKKPEEQTAEDQTPVRPKGKLYRLLEKLGVFSVADDVRAFAQQMMGMREQVAQQNEKVGDSKNADNNSSSNNNNNNSQQQLVPSSDPESPPVKKTPPPVAPKPQPLVAIDPTYWTRELDIPKSKISSISEDEDQFWKFLIEEYLHPIKANKEQQDKIAADLLSARNNVVYAYMLINLMFTLVLLQLKMQMDTLKDAFYIAGEYEPVSTVSLAVFCILLLTQFTGMLGHRWSTFMHLIASTRLTWFSSNEEEERALAAIQEAQKLTSAGAEGDLDLMQPDYSDEEDEDEDYTTSAPPSTTLSPRASNADLFDIAEDYDDEMRGMGMGRRGGGGGGGEEPPDYSSSEEGEEEDEEEETDLGGGRRGGSPQRSVQYDHVFDKRFKSVRRHITEQQKPKRQPLFQKNVQPDYYGGAGGGGGGGGGGGVGVARPRNARLDRRKSLYMPDKGAAFARRNSIFPV